jgi:hypothetical protein
MSEPPTKSRVARKTRSALPVSAAALQAAVKVKANASSQAATITASIRVVGAVAMVAPSTFFVQWIRVPNMHRLPQIR